MPRSGVFSFNPRSSSLGVVHLNQHRHAQAMCERLELAELRIIEAGDDEKDAIGAERACLVHLVGIDDEVLAQRW